MVRYANSTCMCACNLNLLHIIFGQEQENGNRRMIEMPMIIHMLEPGREAADRELFPFRSVVPLLGWSTEVVSSREEEEGGGGGSSAVLSSHPKEGRFSSLMSMVPFLTITAYS